MPECDRCDRYFRAWYDYNQHIANSPRHHICDDCSLDFESWLALRQHYIQSRRHHYCRECDTHLDDADELREHCKDEHDYCDICDRFFKSAQGLHEHNRQSHHYCVPCRRVFNSENSLKQHMNSNLHRPRDVQCAFHFRGCDQSFISKSAMILHLESGYCQSGATRQMINRWVRLNDRDNVITVPQRLIEGGDITQTIATERSWNGRAYECVLCHGDFRTLDALNRHLASPRHGDRIYRCPLSSCCLTFRTLSGLCQHVESERCGVLRFRETRQLMDQALSDMGRLRITASRIFKVRDGFTKVCWGRLGTCHT